VPEMTDTWTPVLPADRAEVAVAVARDVAERLRHPETVKTAVAAVAQQTASPETAGWQPHGLSQGDAGLALMCAYLDACFPDEGWDATGHQYLALAGTGVQQATRLFMSLFGGLSGFAFAIWSLSRGGSRYQKMLKSIEDVLLRETVTLAEGLARQQPGMAVGQFDLIFGLGGIGAYLLCRQEDDAAVAALHAVLRSMVTITVEEQGLPRWHTPPHLMPTEAAAEQYPNGYLNCGLAHGIPGPLTLMALALAAGLDVPGLADAIERSALWLVKQRADDQWGANWPTAAPLEPTLTPNGAVPRLQPSRSAWCYGSPGVARALWLAGTSLDQPGLCEQAVEAMAAVYRRPLHVRYIDSPTFCHGIAGLLQITLRFAHDTGLPLFTGAARTLSEQLLGLYEPGTTLGYRNLELDGQRVDQPGLLEGTPGVALVLLATATDVEPTWDRVFLLS